METPIYSYLTALYAHDPLAERDVVAEAEALLHTPRHSEAHREVSA